MSPKIVTTIEEVRKEVDSVSAIAASGDPNWAQHLGSFTFEPPIDHLKKLDPRSDQYFAEQYRLYEELTGRTYEVHNELHGSDPFPGVYPFFTGNMQEIGTHLMRVANVIRCLPLQRGAKVLELGAGWGNLSVLMAQSGLDVTTVDIEPRFAQIIEDRARAAGVSIRARCQDFISLADDTEMYDCGLFFEAFHHSRNHLELLKLVDQRISRDGIIVWGSEPIWEHLSLPWSLRFDSLSVYCIRRFGWFETGFTESYFVDLLMRSGWICQKTDLSDLSSSTVFVAKRSHGLYKPGEIHLPPDHGATWHGPEVNHRWTTGSSLIRLPEGAGSVTLQVKNHSAKRRKVELTLGKNNRKFEVKPGVLTELTIERDPLDSLLRIDSETWRPSDRGAEDKRLLGICVEQMEFTS